MSDLSNFSYLDLLNVSIGSYIKVNPTILGHHYVLYHSLIISLSLFKTILYEYNGLECLSYWHTFCVYNQVRIPSGR